jgi:Cof subfamily protein (haloacid dehalogenase superfamily)
MILALDLDDTLLRTDKTIGDRTLQALRRWLAAGHEVIVATGRPPRWVHNVLPPELHDAPRVVYNGAQVIVGDNVVYRNEIAPTDVRTVVEWTLTCRPHWHMGLEINDELYLNRASQKGGVYAVADLLSLCERSAAKIIFLFGEEREDLAPLLDALPAATRALITPKFSMVQLCGATTSKADAIAHLLAQRGLSFDSLAAIGDDVNDVEMLRCAGIGIAVGNALDEVKTAADWVTDAADDDGVAAAIERLLEPNHVSTQPIFKS